MEATGGLASREAIRLTDVFPAIDMGHLASPDSAPAIAPGESRERQGQHGLRLFNVLLVRLTADQDRVPYRSEPSRGEAGMAGWPC